MSTIKHQNNFATNLTSNQTSGVTTTPLNSIPSVDAPYYIALDATNLNSKYEVVYVTSDTATNINHAATTYAHTTAEEVRMVVPADELDNAQTAFNTGWTPILDTWTYASASTITVPAGAAALYAIGDKIKLTNTTVKYFVITTVADTLLTVAVNTDYVVANAAISSIFVSRGVSPVGYPDWFAYTPTGPTNTTLAGRFTVQGRMVHCQVSGNLTGTPVWTNMPTLPITASANMPASGNASSPCGVGGYRDDGTANRVSDLTPQVFGSGTTVKVYVNAPAGDQGLVTATSPITWAASDYWFVWFNYEI